ncbi:M61 family metallopeptidase [Arcticibacter eurypsychrophilus]|uniref:M61 family metallopeptidase n=1 Tax=Arcticibacter eurypsychrophilus TaxID=1434752 RepID=UPI00084D73D9|nr:PDZ domain-containing protein [Arcticibacter eurypsychrophilus]
MNKFTLFSVLVLFIMLFTIKNADAQTEIAFELSFSEPQAHYVDVNMILSGVDADFIDVKMPVWAPGSYLVREFSKNVEQFGVKGLSGTEILPFVKINKNTWRITTNHNKKITVSYKVYAFEISVRTSFVDDAHAFISPTGVFMYVNGMLNLPAVVTVQPFAGWKKVSTGLEPLKGFSYRASDFDVLFDSPIEIGNQDTFEFDAAGTKHTVAMVGSGNYDKARLSVDMAKIVNSEKSIFDHMPNTRYVFIVHNMLKGGGGLEHLNSTVLGASRDGYGTEKGYTNFLGLVAHEYFHLWNVKRLRPEALGPFDYDNENYTTDLWISEGFTAYYDNLILRRNDFYSPEKYLDVICSDIEIVENQAGTKIQPVAESSFDAWIKYYRPNENSKNTGISYYNKGALLGMILDLEIINATKAQKGLDDVMKAMYDEYYLKLKRGFTSLEFKAMAEKVSGISLDAFYREYVYQAGPINYSIHLDHAGLNLLNDYQGKEVASLGLVASNKEGKFIVSSVMRDGAAWKEGISVNDEIIAVDGNRFTGAVEVAKVTTDLDQYIANRKAGEKVNVLLSRDGLIKTVSVTLQKDPKGKFHIENSNDATVDQFAVRKRWLNL